MSKGLRKWKRVHFPVFVNENECGSVAEKLLKEVCVFNGKHKKNELYNRMGNGVDVGFAKAGNMVMKWGRRVELQ